MMEHQNHHQQQQQQQYTFVISSRKFWTGLVTFLGLCWTIYLFNFNETGVQWKLRLFQSTIEPNNDLEGIESSSSSTVVSSSAFTKEESSYSTTFSDAEHSTVVQKTKNNVRTNNKNNKNNKKDITIATNSINSQSSSESSITNVVDGKIRVIFYSSGCSGSSAVYRMTKQIMIAHGLKVYNADKELFKPKKNTKYKEAKQLLIEKKGIKNPNKKDILLESFQLLNDDAYSKGKVLFMFAKSAQYSIFQELEERYQQEQQHDDDDDSSSTFGYYGSMSRRNKLDWAICTVKDCFGNPPGYPVHQENGTKVIDYPCFQRRKYPQVNVTVHLNTKKLIPVLTDKIEDDQDGIEKGINLISPALNQYDNDLFAFEYTNSTEIFEESTNSWELLLRTIVNVNRTILQTTMKQWQNTLHSKKSHKLIIHNFEDVMISLMNTNPPLDYFLRL